MISTDERQEAVVERRNAQHPHPIAVVVLSLLATTAAGALFPWPVCGGLIAAVVLAFTVLRGLRAARWAVVAYGAAFTLVGYYLLSASST